MSSVTATATTVNVTSQEAAILLGLFDALLGRPCRPDAYVYPDDATRAYLRGDYVHSYIVAKGL